MLVAAAHNLDVHSYPWRFASVVSVVSHDGDDPFEFRYNPRPPAEFLARGVDVEVAWLGGGTIVAASNSFAAAHPEQPRQRVARDATSAEFETVCSICVHFLLVAHPLGQNQNRASTAVCQCSSDAWFEQPVEPTEIAGADHQQVELSRVCAKRPARWAIDHLEIEVGAHLTTFKLAGGPGDCRDRDHAPCVFGGDRASDCEW